MQSPLHPMRPYWSESPHVVVDAFHTSEQGLSERFVQDNVRQYGKNLFAQKEKKTILHIFLAQLTSPLIFILIGAAIVTGILGEWIEVVVISLAVLVNAGLGFYREYHAEHTLEKLSTFIKDRSRVIRDGIEVEIDSEDIVPGDVLKLSYGNRVAADARLLSVNNFRVDEAVLTGESLPISKATETVAVTAPVADRTNMVHAGTLVVEGFATAVVVAIGNMTQIGSIASLVSQTQRVQTPIQRGLARLAWIIFAVVIVIVIGIFVLGVVRGEPLFAMLILSVAISVGAVPEALPIALTVILSIGAERIAQKRGVARTLMAAETLGSTTLIMTDKTGTLTEAQMKLVGIHTTEAIMQTQSVSSEDEVQLLTLAVSCVDIFVENPHEPVAAWTFKGKPFEVHIVKTARERGISIEHLKERDVSKAVIPFSSSHKFSVYRYGDGYIVMGAPDIIADRSSFSKEGYQAVSTWIGQASSEGKRLIAIATLPLVKSIATIGDVVDAAFQGVMAFHDPVRKEVPASIRQIESLGVRVVMVTGDLKGTALSVAQILGWEVTEANVLTGADIAQLSDDALRALLPSIRIYARVTPQDKLRIGGLYRSLGEVVAMTGDGVNDSPALKAMDIGVALGSGSDVAKSAADLVLLDDNFHTITAAIIEGRRILSNIRKTFVYLMSNSLDEVFVVGGSLIIGIPIPLTALQIIWVNLFTGSLPALAFAYDEDFDRTKTQTVKHTALFTRAVNVLTFGVGIASSLLLFGMYALLHHFGVEASVARSVFFICFASYILVIAYSFRSLYKPLFSYPVFSNKRLNQSIIIATLILILTMALPALRTLFGLSLIPLVWGWFIAGWLVLNVLLVEGAKYFFRKHHA